MPPTDDFNGDGRSDVLLRNTGGTFNEWLGRTDGTFASNIANVNYGLTTDWHVSGTADFNGDGRNDILLRNDNGTINEWLGLPDGSYASNIANVNIPLSNSWRVVGTADFNGDGRSDVLLRNDNGTINEWLGLPDGSFASNLANVNYGLSTAWQVAGTGDFNGDGRNDVLLRNDNGTINEWLGLPDGSFASNLANVNIALDNAWHVVGTGDFNGDGRSDVLLRNDNGTVNEWLGLSDGSFASNLSRVNYASTTDWHIVGVGDFNGDAIDDLIWQNNDGSIRDWLGQSDRSFVTNTFNVNPGNEWAIADTFVHDPFLPV